NPIFAEAFVRVSSFFFSSRRRHTRCLSDWSSDVCSSDLAAAQNEQYLELMHTPDFSHTAAIAREIGWHDDFNQLRDELLAHGLRSEERRVGKEGRARGVPR